MNPKGIPATVLMADDDPDDCFFVKDAFRKTSMAKDFRCVEDGQELLDYLHRRGKYSDSSLSPCPDLILLDLNMPKKDGREALKEIKSHPDFRSIPIVIFTTSREAGDIVKSYDMGANSFMTKPADFNELIDFVRTLEAYWFEIVTLPPQRQGC